MDFKLNKSNLNFRVYSAASLPSTAQGNDICIISDVPMKNWILSPDAPRRAPRTDGDVWIQYSVTGNTVNVVKTGAMMVATISAWQYVDGVWVVKDAMTYQSGEWLSWGLPSIYQEVAYLKSSGTQAIDTGYIQNASTEFFFDFAPVYTQWAWPMGVVNGSNYFGLQCTYSANNMTVHLGSDASKYGATYSNNVRYKIEYKDGSLYVDGNKKGDYIMSQVSATENVYLFAENTNDSISGASTTTIYRFTISENGIIIHDFVPCYRKDDSVAGMFDLKGRTFHTNIGSGTFAVGGDV